MRGESAAISTTEREPRRQGKNLLIIEHTEDADASLEVSTSTNASGYNLSGTAAMTMVKHFHIVCYDAGDQQYIPVDQRDGAFSLAPSPGVRIRESRTAHQPQGVRIVGRRSACPPHLLPGMTVWAVPSGPGSCGIDLAEVEQASGQGEKV